MSLLQDVEEVRHGMNLSHPMARPVLLVEAALDGAEPRAALHEPGLDQTVTRAAKIETHAFGAIDALEPSTFDGVNPARVASHSHVHKRLWVRPQVVHVHVRFATLGDSAGQGVCLLSLLLPPS